MTLGVRLGSESDIGFGRSDKRTDVGGYSFARHFAELERFAEALDLRRITFVVQDWGGPLGLHYAVRHHERVARLVILNTALLSGEAVTLSPGLLRWREYALRTPDLPVGQIIRRAVVEPAGLSDAVVAAYGAPFPTLESKAGARAFPALIPTRPDARPAAPRCARPAPRSHRGTSRRSSASATRIPSFRP